MGQVQSLLASRYLPKTQDMVEQAYRACGIPGAMAGHLALLHLYLWKKALTDESYDLTRVRRAICRMGYRLEDETLDEIDSMVAERLAELLPEAPAEADTNWRAAIQSAQATLHARAENLLAA